MSNDNETSAFSCTTKDKAVDSAFIILGSVLGSTANTLIILTTIFVKSMRKSMYWLILNVAIADLIVCGYIMPNIVVNRIACRNVSNASGCTANAFIIFMCAGVSNFTFMLIGINRRMFILRSDWYRPVFGGKKMFVIIISVWVCWLLLTLMPLFTNSFSYIDEAFFCFYYDDYAPFWISFILSLVAVAFPTFICAGCYISIFKVLFDTKKKLRANINAKDESGNDASSLSAQEKRSVISAVIAFVFFNLCWGPYSVHLYFDKYGIPVPEDPHRVILWLSIFNSACNPFVLIITNSLYRRGILQLVCRKAAVGPSGGSFATNN